MRGGIAPAEREHAVKYFLPIFPGAIAHGRKIRDQTEKPEEERDGEISADRKNVPHQRAAKLRPHAHGVGIGKEPVENPWTSQMQQWKKTGASDRKKRHRFGETIDRSAPMLKHQKQDRGNEGSGVSDPDPPHEIYNRKSPRDRNIDSPNPNSADEQPRDGKEKNHEQSERNGESDPPRPRLSILQHDGADCLIDGLERLLADEQIRRVP